MKKLVITTCCILSFSFAIGQQNIVIDKKDFNIEELGFKEAWEHVKTAEKFFNEGIGSYAEALESYRLAAEYNTYNPQLNYKMGICCLFSEKKADALEYFKKAYEFKNDVAEDIHLMLGRSYHYTHEFDLAIQEYRIYQENLDEKQAKKSEVDIEKLIAECENGKILLGEMVPVIITNAGETINSPYDDYNSLITESGNRMYFTSRRQNPSHERRNFFDNKFNEDIYVSYLRNGNWEPAQAVGKPVNTDYNDAALALADQDNKLYIYYGNSNNGDIYVSELKKGTWSKPKRLPGKFNTKARETTITFSTDGRTLFFISDSKKETLGGSDIFVCHKNEKDNWEKPVNFGPAVNTPYDEESVFLHPGGKMLYFSSKGHNTMGGFDIFQTTLLENGEWSQPVNLGYPINSSDDDLFFSTTWDSTIAYFSSSRGNSFGMKDIFKVTYLPSIQTDDLLPEAMEYPEFELVYLAFSDAPPVLEKDLSVVLRGMVLDEEDSIPVMARLEIIDMDRNEVIATSISDREAGTYSIRLEERKNYGVEITSQGYMLLLDIIDIPVDTETSEMKRDFRLKKVKVGERIILKNIFFELNKSTLSPASYEELGRVLKLLESNPNLRIEISGHTDNVGSFQVNQRLSEARAKAVVDYLNRNGIDLSRLEYAGYAFSQPVATNDTPEGRAQNRRVEFKILSN